MFKISKIVNMLFKLSIIICVYNLIFSTLNVNSAPIEKFIPLNNSSSLKLAYHVGYKACAMIDDESINGIFNPQLSENEFKAFITKKINSTKCPILFEKIVEMVKYACLKTECHDNSISTKNCLEAQPNEHNIAKTFIQEISKNYMESLKFLYSNLEKITHKFRANDNKSVKIVIEEFDKLNNKLEKFQHLIFAKYQYDKTNEDFSKKQIGGTALNALINILAETLQSIQLLFSVFTHKILTQFPKITNDNLTSTVKSMVDVRNFQLSDLSILIGDYKEGLLDK